MNDKDRYWDCLDRAMEASHGGRTDDALAWLDEALRAQPNGAEAHNGRGEILWDEGRIDEAALPVRARDAGRPEVRHRAPEPRRAARSRSSASTSRPSQLLRPAALRRATALPRPDRATEAEMLLPQVEGALLPRRPRGRAVPGAARDPTSRPRSRSTAPSRARSASSSARFEEARRRLERAVALDSESAHAVYHLGLVLERLGQRRRRRARAFQQANALDPDHYPLPVSVGRRQPSSASPPRRSRTCRARSASTSSTCRC